MGGPENQVASKTLSRWVLSREIVAPCSAKRVNFMAQNGLKRWILSGTSTEIGWMFHTFSQQWALANPAL